MSNAELWDVIIFWSVIFVIFLIGGPLWRIVKLFFIVLLATLGINFVKKEVKDWWNKD